MRSDDTYYINVTFQRSRSSDSDVIRDDINGDSTDAQLLAQFAKELQAAYGRDGSMGGLFDMHSLNGAPFTDEQKKAIGEAIEKEIATW